MLACIFPGFYDPFWPHHSDYYIAQALAYSEGGALQILTQPRPLALLLFSLFGRLGIHGSVIASFGVVVANYIGIAMMMRRAFQLEISCHSLPPHRPSPICWRRIRTSMNSRLGMSFPSCHFCSCC